MIIPETFTVTASSREEFEKAEAERLRAEEEKRAKQRLEEDKAWVANWPPKGKKQTEYIDGYFESAYFRDQIYRGSLTPFYLTDPAGSGQRERVTAYHFSCVSGDEWLADVYRQDQNDDNTVSLSVHYDASTKPGRAELRVYLVSEHYYASTTTELRVMDTKDIQTELLSADVNVPVGVGVRIAWLFEEREFVKTDPALQYDCSVSVDGKYSVDTKEYTLDAPLTFTAKEPGDYPLTLLVRTGAGYQKEFTITVHASYECSAAAVVGEAPMTEEAMRFEKEVMRSTQESRLSALQRMASNPSKYRPAYILENVGEHHYLYHIVGKEAVIDQIAPTGTALEIPASLGNVPVTVIGNNALTDQYIEKLTLPKGIREVRERAFEGCVRLSSLRLPESLEHIAARAFYGCAALKDIALPANLTYNNIGNLAFGGCGMEDILLADGTSLQSRNTQAYMRNGIDGSGVIFSTCANDLVYILRDDGSADIVGMDSASQKTMIYIPETLNGHPVRGIGARAFANRFSLTAVRIGEGVETIGDGAFTGCDKLVEVRLPSTLKAVGAKAFMNIGAQELSFPEGVKTLSPDSFLGPEKTDGTGKWKYRVLTDGTAMITGCRMEKKISFPGQVDGTTVTAIGIPYDSGDGRDEVKEIVLPGTVTRIDDSAFEGTYALTKITLPDSLTAIGERSFRQSGLTQLSVPRGVRTIGSSAFEACKIKKVTFSNGIRTIGENAFAGNQQITSVDLPESLEYLGAGAFKDNKVTTVVIRSDALRLGVGVFGYKSTDGTIRDYYADPANADGSGITKLNLSCYPGSTAHRLYRYNTKVKLLSYGKKGQVTAPAQAVLTREALGSDAVIEELTIPEGVLEIADDALRNAASLRKLSLPSTLVRIGARAFDGCISLETLTLPKNLEAIGTAAFRGCSNLRQVTIPAGVTVIPEEAFNLCEALTKVTFPARGLVQIGPGAFASTALTSVNIPASVSKIGRGAFQAADKLTTLTLPQGLVTIPDMMCAYCYSLKSIKLPGSVTAIGEKAFYYCHSLSAVTLNEGLREIGASAFAQNTRLVQGTYKTFRGKELVTALKTIKLPASLQKIGSGAFACCDALTAVTFAKDSELGELGDRVFAVCVSLKEITLPNSGFAAGEGVFVNCLGLKKADLGEGIKKIGNEAFMHCDAMTELKTPASLEVIGTDILKGHGKGLKVICPAGSAMEKHLKQYYPEVSVARTGR